MDSRHSVDGEPVTTALFAICAGTWDSRYYWTADATSDFAVIMFIGEDLVMRWIQLADYPGYVRVTYIGSPDEF
jgi:hypothetical protein